MAVSLMCNNKLRNMQCNPYYIHQVNGAKLADILFSFLSVSVCLCVCILSPVFNSVCPSHNASATWQICTLSEHLLVYGRYANISVS